MSLIIRFNPIANPISENGRKSMDGEIWNRTYLKFAEEKLNLHSEQSSPKIRILFYVPKKYLEL